MFFKKNIPLLKYLLQLSSYFHILKLLLKTNILNLIHINLSNSLIHTITSEHPTEVVQNNTHLNLVYNLTFFFSILL